MITVDFETRSTFDLLKGGAYAYSKDLSTRAMCLAWLFDGENDLGVEDVGLWHRAHPDVGIEESPWPEELCDRIASGEVVEAHNSFFEYCIWNHVFRREFPELPELRLEQMRCSAAKAAAFALPRALDELAMALRVQNKKDPVGKRIMLKLSKPRRLLNAEKKELVARRIDPATFVAWNEDPDDLRTLWAYCKQDVRTEHDVSKALPPLSERELELWRMDQRMNARGIYCDVRGAETALKVAGREVDALNAELRRITLGAVQKGSSRIKFKEWARANGLVLKDTRGETIEKALKLDRVKPDVKRALTIVKDVNRSSTAKYKQMLRQVSDGDRIRDMMLYCGAGRTGRWSGKGVQPHNFVRGFSADMEDAWLDILTEDRERLHILYGSTMDCLAKATRGALTSSPGKDLMVADYAAIEARVLLWLAEDEEGLGIFYRGEDPYCAMASEIYGKPINKADHPKERQMGKKAILGLGFQMGDEKFDDECAKDGIFLPREFFTHVVKTYRKKFEKVVSLWKEMEEGAIKCVLTGKPVRVRKCRFFMRKRFLHCELPSGRPLSYFEPVVSQARTYTWAAKTAQGKKSSVRVVCKTNVPPGVAYQNAVRLAKLGEKTLLRGEPIVFDKAQLTFLAINQKTRQFERTPTYGGSLVENITQATARDMLAEGMLRVDQHEAYDLLLSVHDEVIGECEEGTGDVKEFEELMSELPSWAHGCPVKAEGWRGKRYRK